MLSLLIARVISCRKVNDVYQGEFIDHLTNQYDFSNFHQLYFTDDEGPVNSPVFGINNQHKYGNSAFKSGATSDSDILSEWNIVLAEEQTSQYHHGAVMRAGNIEGYRDTDFTQTAFKFYGLLENLDQNYIFPKFVYTYKE